jgi:hypothetical protein
MILTFSQERFKHKILEGVKKTTIRQDTKNRWKEGRKIQFWMHNPRNVSKKPHQFATGAVLDVEDIFIYPEQNTIRIRGQYYKNNTKELDKIAKKDGFQDWEDMKLFFPENFHGKRIWFCIDEKK